MNYHTDFRSPTRPTKCSATAATLLMITLIYLAHPPAAPASLYTIIPVSYPDYYNNYQTDTITGTITADPVSNQIITASITCTSTSDVWTWTPQKVYAENCEILPTAIVLPVSLLEFDSPTIPGTNDSQEVLWSTNSGSATFALWTQNSQHTYISPSIYYWPDPTGWFIATATTTVPEPATLIVWSLLGTLAISVGWRRRKRAA